MPPPSPPNTMTSLLATPTPNPPRLVGIGANPVSHCPVEKFNASVCPIVELMATFRPPIAQSLPFTTAPWKCSRTLGMLGSELQELLVGS